VSNLRQTKALARRFAKKLRDRSGATVLFDAPMGAGKTTFISFVIKELNRKIAVSSPTFSIINKYANNIYHADLYRVDGGDLENTGIFDIIAESGNFVFVEWADKLGPLPPATSPSHACLPPAISSSRACPPTAASLFRVKINILEGTEREFIID
jgi:tRNA threonylcarbamoyladenosine biosynthesis protein TsaE